MSGRLDGVNSELWCAAHCALRGVEVDAGSVLRGGGGDDRFVLRLACS